MRKSGEHRGYETWTSLCDRSGRAYELGRLVDHKDAEAVFVSGVGMPTIPASTGRAPEPITRTFRTVCTNFSSAESNPLGRASAYDRGGKESQAWRSRSFISSIRYCFLQYVTSRPIVMLDCPSTARTGVVEVKRISLAR